ncbi:MAG: HAMP domain-containing protein [Acidimicrobiia bacterium]|nr:HAMP domain-containing protein [Acidimicrobiia bacterium]
MGTISIRTKILLALALPLLTAVVLLGWGASRYLDSPDSEARTFLLMGSGVMIGVSVLAAALAWGAIRPLQHLATDAQAVVDVRLPALLERMRSADGSHDLRLARLEVSSRDEIGQLANSFNMVQEATVGVAIDQAALLRSGIGDLFVELSKRNQDLIRRQIAFIDELEANEEDPDQLEALFHLDHLATRMQRNAESLLVLAGHETQRPAGGPIDIGDVIRVAQGEVQGFARVATGAMVTASVDSSVAVDLAHLLAELIENAAMYSPAETPVMITSETDGTALAISIVDSGPGLDPARLRAANELLANPPLLGLTGATDLGWNLVSRLADRHDIHVELRPAGTNGLQAIVALPTALLHGALSSATTPTEMPRSLLFPGDEQAPTPEPVEDDHDLEPDAVALDTDDAMSPAAPSETPLSPVVDTVDAQPLPTRTPLTTAESEQVDPAAPTVEPAEPPGPATGDTAIGESTTPETVPAEASPLPARTPLDEPIEDTTPAAATDMTSDLFADPDPFAPAVHTPVPSTSDRTPPFGSLGTEPHETGASAHVAATSAYLERLDADPDIDDPTGVPEQPGAASGDDPDSAHEAPTAESTTTAAGLVRRPLRSGPQPEQRVDDTTSPEAIREMLSRYRTGLDKGRTTGTDVAEENE